MNTYRSILLLSALSLCACSSGPGTIFRQFDVDKTNTSISIDARQRTIIARRPDPQSRPGLIAPHSIVCAEPSPDVATALATSFGAGISVLGEGSGALSAEAAEGVVQLSERTAAIQLMRDQMYRACEAYANGAITGTNYSLLMSQITSTMVTLLLGETAGGAFGRTLAALGSKASATASASLAGLPLKMDEINGATQQLADAELKVSNAKEKVATTNASTTATAPEKAAAADELKKAEAERDALKDLLQNKIDATTSATGEITKLIAGGGIQNKPDAAVANVLADMQKTFVQRDPSHALVEACLVELGVWNVRPEVGDLFSGPARELVGKEGLNPHTVPGLVIAAAKMEQTGLFEFCRTYLPTIGPEIYRTNAAIEMERVNLERRALDLQLLEAKATTMGSFATALSQCDRITDEFRRKSCTATVLSLQSSELPALSDRMRGVQAVLVRSVGENALPTLAYDRAKDVFDKAGGRVSELTNLQLNDVAASDDQQEVADLANRKSELEGSRRDLTATVNELLNGSRSGFGTGTPDSIRGQLEQLERQQADLTSSVQLAADPFDQQVQVAELERARAKARERAELYGNLATELNRQLGEIENLISEFRAFGVKSTQ